MTTGFVPAPWPALSIPVITTARLTLRAFAPDDFEPYAVMMADPEVTRHLGEGRPLARADAWRQLAMLIGHWVLRGYGVWAVEERATGRFLGRIGCMEQEGFPAFEIAYTLGPWARGRGYAREGAAAALRFAREMLGRTYVTSIIRPANHASIRVATALGARPGPTVEFFGAPSVLYEYPLEAERGV